MKWELTKKQKKELIELGWTPAGFWFGLDWDYKGNALSIVNRFLGKELPDDADGYDFIVVAYRKSYREEQMREFYSLDNLMEDEE
mgnify:CR=1 FL=1|jgi:hypothetical protein